MGSEIVLMDKLNGVGIYDTLEKSFIGFRKKKKQYQRYENKIKSVWTKPQFAKSAFKEHTGTYFSDQSRYEIRSL